MRGRVSLRGRRARASEGRFLCVLRVETGRRHDARLWLRGVAGLSIRDPCFERPPSRCRRALEGPVRVCIHSRRRSNRCTSGGARRAPRDVAAEARPLHGQVRQDARRRARRPRQAPRRRRAEDVAGVRARSCESVRDSAAASTRRRRGASVGRSALSVGRVEGGYDAGLLQ